MTADASDDSWMAAPAPAPRAVKGHPAALPAGDPAAGLAAQLLHAPVVAEPAPPLPEERSAAPDPGAPPPTGKGGPPPRGRPKGQIWEGCPVTALGMNGDFFYFLDRHGQLRATKAEMKASQILGYFGRIELLRTRFPKYTKGSDDPEKRNFNSQAANFTMIEACHEKGLFNPDGAVRGVGAWTDDDGRLVYHTGDTLITVEGAREPGEIDGRIYPAYPPIPHPTLTGGRQDAAEKILADLSTFNWARPDIDPMLGLGMICVQKLGGALAWRPTFWMTGDKASGKSTLQEMLKWLHGDRGLIQSNDPTKSGITARLGHSALPVALDELEPGEEGSNRERDIITLARVASSGGQWLRGTADQKGASGNVYSAFVFSSILIPGALTSADRSRLITLNLSPPAKGAVKPVLDPRTLKARGAALLRILIDRWPTWAERLALWREALAEFDLDGRNGDNWATTLAMADMALRAELPDAEQLSAWARKVSFGAKAEVDDIGSNAEDMLLHLLGQPFDVFRRGELWNVAHWLMVAGQLPAAPHELIAGTDGGMIDDQVRAEAARRANEKLAKIGLRVKGTGEAAELFIPNKPIPGLRKLFEHSQWANGVWSQAARRVPGASATQATLAGQTTRGVYVPFRSIGGLLAFPMDRPATPPAPATPDDWKDFG